MTTPAGWYDDGSGRQRWWDGQQWTEHFAPEAPAPATPEVPTVPEIPAEPEVPAESEIPAAAVPEAGAESPAAPRIDPTPEVPTSSDHVSTSAFAFTAEQSSAPAQDAVEDTVVALQAAPDWSAPAAPPVPPVPQNVAPSYPGAAAPAYPAAPGAYASAPHTYAAPGAYAAGGYPASAPYAASAPTGPKKMSVLGLVGLGLAVLGTILACIPVTAVIGWILLPAGFIVSLISLFLKGTKWPGIAGLGVSVLGTILAIIMGFVFLSLALSDAIDTPSSYPSSIPEATELPDDGTTPTDVAEGGMGEPVTVQQMSGSAEVTVSSASWSATNDSGFDPTNGGYLVIDLAWETTDGTTYVNPLYFAVETAEGAAGDYDIFGEATLEASELTAGQTTQGTVSFDVAQSSSYVIVITDELLQEVARITVEPSAG